MNCSTATRFEIVPARVILPGTRDFSFRAFCWTFLRHKTIAGFYHLFIRFYFGFGYCKRDLEIAGPRA